MGQTKISSRSPKFLGERNLKLHVAKMNAQQLEQAIKTINEDPTAVTIVDNHSKENKINSETTKYQTRMKQITIKTQIRRSSRIKSKNSIARFGNP